MILDEMLWMDLGKKRAEAERKDDTIVQMRNSKHLNKD